MGVADEGLDAEGRSRRFTYIETGTVVSVLPDGTLTVNLAGATLQMPTLVRVQAGDLVQVLRANDTAPLCIGSTFARPTLGTVASFVNGVSVTILGTDGVTYNGLPYLLQYTPVVGHLVSVSWSDQGGIVLGRVSAQAGQGDPSVVPPPPPVPTEGIEYFAATDSASYRGAGPWTNKVYFSENQIGIWTYGTKIRDTLAGATALDGSAIYLPVELASGLAQPSLGVHGASAVTPTAPAVSGATVIPAPVDSSGWYGLPTAFAQYLIDNVGAGISTYGAGYRIFTGTQGNNDSGRLAIKYRR